MARNEQLSDAEVAIIVMAFRQSGHLPAWAESPRHFIDRLVGEPTQAQVDCLERLIAFYQAAGRWAGIDDIEVMLYSLTGWPPVRVRCALDQAAANGWLIRISRELPN